MADAAGPVVRDNIYAGGHDARRELAGWDRAGFDDRSWQSVEAMTSPTQRLESQLMPPVKVDAHIIEAVAVKRPKADVAVYDLGENVAGWAGSA